MLRWLSTAGWVSVEGGFGEDDMGSTMLTPGHVRGLGRGGQTSEIVKTSDGSELVDHVHKFLHNVPLADRSFSGMGHVLRHAMCRAAHGEGAGEITSPCL